MRPPGQTNHSPTMHGVIEERRVHEQVSELSLQTAMPSSEARLVSSCIAMSVPVLAMRSILAQCSAAFFPFASIPRGPMCSRPHVCHPKGGRTPRVPARTPRPRCCRASFGRRGPWGSARRRSCGTSLALSTLVHRPTSIRTRTHTLVFVLARVLTYSDQVAQHLAV